ncbi:MAG: pilus assembly protein PilM, partial [Candidatus Omnitrophica bacterium]|nr:pilus assembly protein PilM [Candidatus Omnitrophota bacterium]
MPRLDFKKIKGLSRVVSRDILAVELEKSRLKIVQVKLTPQHEEIVNIIQRDITGLKDAEITNLILGIRDTILQKKLEVIDIITPSSVITKNIEIPSTDPQEIKEIVNLQAGRHTPYAREEIIVDFLNLGVYRKNYTRILLVIVNRNIVKRHFDILARAGFVPEKVVFSAEAVALSSSRLLNISTEDRPWGVIHIDEENTDFIIILKNKPIFIRQIPIGAKQLVFEKEKFYLRFLEEIKRSQDAYLAEDIEKMPSNFILTGGIEAISGLEQSMD